jgi:hypothetical protein
VNKNRNINKGSDSKTNASINANSMSNNQINGVSSNKKYNEGKQKMGEQKRYHRNE